MSSNATPKFRYRIVVRNDADYPYHVERKGLIFWKLMDKCRRRDDADDVIRKCIHLELMRPGTVLVEYTEQDYVMDKLRGT